MLFGAKKIKCIVNYKNKQYIYELDRQNTINDIYNMFLKDQKCSPQSNPLIIRFCSNKAPFTINDYDIPLISLDKDKLNELKFEITKPFHCSNCDQLCSKYCLKCSEYFCTKCKFNEHKGHDNIDVDPTNLRESIYLWQLNLNGNLSDDTASFNKFKDFIEDNELSIKVNLWKESIIKKLNTFEKFINEICDLYNKIGNNFIVKKNKILNKLLQDLSKVEQKINNELEIEKENNNKNFSYEESESLIQELKKIHFDIKSNNKDIKDLDNLENSDKLHDIMGYKSSQFEDLTKNSLKILESFQNFVNKHDENSNSNKENSFITISSPHHEPHRNILAYSVNTNKLYYFRNEGKNSQKKLYSLGKRNLNIAVKETNLSTKDSYNTGKKVNLKGNKKLLNSFKKNNIKNIKPYKENKFTELNLSKIKLKGELNEKDNFLYSDRYHKHPSTDRNDKIGFLPLINKI